MSDLNTIREAFSEAGFTSYDVPGLDVAGKKGDTVIGVVLDAYEAACEIWVYENNTLTSRNPAGLSAIRENIGAIGASLDPAGTPEPTASSMAEAMARVTGSVSATATIERRNEDGSLTVIESATWERERKNVTVQIVVDTSVGELVRMSIACSDKACKYASIASSYKIADMLSHRDAHALSHREGGAVTTQRSVIVDVDVPRDSVGVIIPMGDVEEDHNDYGHEFRSVDALEIRGTFKHQRHVCRWMIIYRDETTWTRKTFGADMVQGEHAYLVPLPSIVGKYAVGRRPSMVETIEDGTLIEILGRLFRVADDIHGNNPRLVRV